MKDLTKICLSLITIAALLVYSMFVTTKSNAGTTFVIPGNITVEETGYHDQVPYTVFSDKKTCARILYYKEAMVLLPMKFN